MSIYRRTYRSTTTTATARTTGGKVRVVPPAPPVVEPTPIPPVDVPGDTAPGPDDAVAQDMGSVAGLANDEGQQPPQRTTRSRKASTDEGA
jgi:hypothetical protein